MTLDYDMSDSELIAAIGARIRAERLRRNLLLEDLAERCAMSRNTLSKIESGGSTTTTNLLAALRALRLLEPIFELAAAPSASPIEKLARKTSTQHGRVRASGASKHKTVTKRLTTQRANKTW